MAKISKKTIDSLEEFMDRGCEYSGTQDIVNDLMDESLREMGAKIIQADDVTLTDWDEDTIGMLDDFEIGSFENWLKETGYRSGELYVNYEEFCDIEYQDKEYMRNLLGDEELLKLYYEDIAND